MFCPQCGTESSDGQQYCRMCGANLKFIGKAVSLSEAVARSDRGPLPKLKEVVQGFKSGHTAAEGPGSLDRTEEKKPVDLTVAEQAPPPAPKSVEVAEQRRENHLVKGTVSLFTGVGLMVFLYYFTAALVLKIPPEDLAKIPFEVEPVARMLWLIGLIPAMSGLGRIIAGLLIRTPRRAIDGPATRPERLEASQVAEPRRAIAQEPARSFGVESARGLAPEPVSSVTEGTTELLDGKVRAPGGAQAE